jgi:MFS superfamily sulfate permease-like transporter
VNALPILGLLAGIRSLLVAFAGVGRPLHSVPWPVVSGILNSVAVISALQQLPAALHPLRRARMAQTAVNLGSGADNLCCDHPRVDAAAPDAGR